MCSTTRSSTNHDPAVGAAGSTGLVHRDRGSPAEGQEGSSAPPSGPFAGIDTNRGPPPEFKSPVIFTPRSSQTRSGSGFRTNVRLGANRGNVYKSGDPPGSRTPQLPSPEQADRGNVHKSGGARVSNSPGQIKTRCVANPLQERICPNHSVQCPARECIHLRPTCASRPGLWPYDWAGCAGSCQLLTRQVLSTLPVVARLRA